MIIIIYHLIAWQEESIIVLPFNKSVSCVAVCLSRLYMVIVKRGDLPLWKKNSQTNKILFLRGFFYFLPAQWQISLSLLHPPQSISPSLLSPSNNIVIVIFTCVLVRAKCGRLPWPPGLLKMIIAWHGNGDILSCCSSDIIVWILDVGPRYQFIPIFSIKGQWDVLFEGNVGFSQLALLSCLNELLCSWIGKIIWISSLLE